MIFTNALTNPGGTNGLIQARADIAREGFTAVQPAATAAKTYATNAATGLQAKSDHMWNDAADFNSPAREQREVGKALAGVTQQFGDARDQVQRQSAELGLDPSSPAAQMGLSRMAMGEALGKAQVASTTRAGLEDEGWKRKMAAAGLGLESAKTGSELALTPVNVDRALYGDLAKGYGDVLDASLKSDSNETARMSASAAASNAATNASLAAGRLALENEKFGFEKDQTLWNRSNMTPYQAAMIASGNRAQDSKDLAALAQSFPGMWKWLQGLGGGNTASDVVYGPSSGWGQDVPQTQTPEVEDLGLYF